MRYALEAFDADGSCCLRRETPISQGNLHEIGAELRIDTNAFQDPKSLEDAIHGSGHSRDPEDWLTHAYDMISRFALNARDIDAKSIRFAPVRAAS